MKYRIDYILGKGSSIAGSRPELIEMLKKDKGRDIEDIRKVYKSGVSCGVLETYAKYLQQA